MNAVTDKSANNRVRIIFLFQMDAQTKRQNDKLEIAASKAASHGNPNIVRINDTTARVKQPNANFTSICFITGTIDQYSHHSVFLFQSLALHFIRRSVGECAPMLPMRIADNFSISDSYKSCMDLEYAALEVPLDFLENQEE